VVTLAVEAPVGHRESHQRVVVVDLKAEAEASVAAAASRVVARVATVPASGSAPVSTARQNDCTRRRLHRSESARSMPRAVR
jgi:hypothetical protein